MKPRIVIHQHRPAWHSRAIAGGIAFALLVGAWGIYSYTRASTVSDFERAQLERDKLRDENRRLAKELRTALSDRDHYKDQAAYAQSSNSIDAQACAAVKSSLGDQQAQMADLREQLAFYQGIVAPQDSASVRVYDFKVNRGGAGAYHFDMVLIQSVHHDHRSGGHVDVRFDGMQAGQHASLQLRDIAPDAARSLDFSFRYFQEFSGDFRLPDGFRPVRATVTVLPDGDGQSKVEADYDWAKIEQQDRTGNAPS